MSDTVPATIFDTCVLPLDALDPHPDNPRRGNVDQIAESIRRFGQYRAIVVNRTADPDRYTIIAGHHTVAALRSLNIDSAWCHIIAVDDDQARRMMLADNRVTDFAGYDDERLAALLSQLNGDMSGTFWTEAEMVTHLNHATMTDIDTLIPNPRNYRTHPAEQLAHIVASLQEHGMYRPIVTANDGTILAGHGVVAAAEQLGLRWVPVIQLDIDPSDPGALRVLTADNELIRFADADDRILTDILKELGDIDGLLGTGFDAAQLANLLFVTRPETEVRDANAAAAWAGMPEFEAGSDAVKLILMFDDEAARDDFVAEHGCVMTRKERGTWSTRWPPRPKDDVRSVLFDDE